MKTLAIVLTATGLVAIIWGFPAAFRKKKPYDALAALASLLGTAAVILGVLLLAVPGFFES